MYSGATIRLYSQLKPLKKTQKCHMKILVAYSPTPLKQQTFTLSNWVVPYSFNFPGRLEI